VSTFAAAVVTMAILAAAGLLPVLALTGIRWQVLMLAPLTGAVLAGIAGEFCLAIAGSTTTWFVVLAALVSCASLARMFLRARSDAASPADSPRSRTRTAFEGGRAGQLAGLTGVVTVVAAAAWSLRALRVPSTGFDARDIWLLRASWFADGHKALLTALQNDQLLVSHASYPPLVSAVVAVSWRLTGNQTDRLAVVVLALLNACAIAAFAWCLVEVGRGSAQAISGGLLRRSVVLAAGVTAATLLVLTAFGVYGQFATDGYADPLWSAAAAGAVGYGLVLARSPANTWCAVILLAVAGLTKVEGTATAACIATLIVARAVVSTRKSVSRPGVETATEHGASNRSVVFVIMAGVAGIAMLSVWTLLTKLEHAAPDVSTYGPTKGTLFSRLRLTVDAMVPHLHLLVLALPLSLVAAVAFRRLRRQAGFAGDLWPWAGLAAGLLVVGGAYATQRENTSLWLITSVHRTTMFAVVVAWLIVATCAVVAVTSVASTTEVDPSPQLSGAPEREPDPAQCAPTPSA
jgi:hypothetical protein